MGDAYTIKHTHFVQLVDNILIIYVISPNFIYNEINPTPFVFGFEIERERKKSD